MARAQRPAELKHLNAFLLKESVRDDGDAIKVKPDIVRYPLRADVALEGALYVRHPAGRPVPWAEIVAPLVEDDLGDLRNRHVSAALVVQRNDRWFAITFGFGRHLLRPEVLEVDFGLKVAASLVDPDSVTSLDARSFEERVLQTRRQSSDPSGAESIGLDTEREMLRAVTGALRDQQLGRRISGSVGAGLTARTSTADLGLRLDQLFTAYGSRAYQTRFSHLDRWHAVDDVQLRDRLNDELLHHLADPSVRLAVPEIIGWESAAGFTYTGARDHVFPMPELTDYLNTRTREVTLADLERHELRLVGGDDEVIGTWQIYRTLLWETERDGTVYALIDGAWVAIDADFVARIDERLRRIGAPRFEIPPFDPLEWEEDYNLRLAALDPRRAALDARMARFEDERGTIEICDVFTPDGEFVHVKRSTQAKALSHLFAQGAVSADLFRNLPAFRERCRELLSASPSLVGLIPSPKPDMGLYEAAFLVVTNRPDEVPTGLPFFSRSHLYRVADEIERSDMRISIAGVPIAAGARPRDSGPMERERRSAASTATSKAG